MTSASLASSNRRCASSARGIRRLTSGRGARGRRRSGSRHYGVRYAVPGASPRRRGVHVARSPAHLPRRTVSVNTICVESRCGCSTTESSTPSARASSATVDSNQPRTILPDVIADRPRLDARLARLLGAVRRPATSSSSSAALGGGSICAPLAGRSSQCDRTDRRLAALPARARARAHRASARARRACWRRRTACRRRR